MSAGVELLAKRGDLLVQRSNVLLQHSDPLLVSHHAPRDVDA
jgi:hypothetical protein